MAPYSLLLIASCLALLWGSIEATCKCKEVCPSYKDAWKVSSKCPSEGIEKCLKPHIALPTCHYWGKADEGGCVCNFFGCNCHGCGCSDYHRRLGSPPRASPPKEETSCHDYNFYMSMSEEERNLYLIEKHCGPSLRYTTKDIELRMILEDMADSNGDGTLDCPEFNSAYSSDDVSLLCRGSQ